jgi:hypothetical protein
VAIFECEVEPAPDDDFGPGEDFWELVVGECPADAELPERACVDAAEVAGGSAEAGASQQLAGTIGLGAETPAISDPRPSFCSVRASSLPVASRLLADWNLFTAATVFASHLPFGFAS